MRRAENAALLDCWRKKKINRRKNEDIAVFSIYQTAPARKLQE